MPRIGLMFTALLIQQLAASISQANPAMEKPVSAVSVPQTNAIQTPDDVIWQRLDWKPRLQLPLEHQSRLPSFCSGDYLPYAASFSQGNELAVESDQVEYTEQSGAIFTGNVSLEQQGRQVQANKMIYDQVTGNALFSGDIVFRSGDISMGTEQLSYNANNQHAELGHTRYVIAQSHMRGEANSIAFSDGDSLSLLDTRYTFCEPGQNDWDLKASEINLYQKEGYGEAYHGRLRIKEIPILYMPYYRFPIGDDRLTGFLNPEISLSVTSNNDTPFAVDVNEFATPFYINIAPNYDDTFTPRYVSDHGLMAENEFRYLNALGEGQIDLSYLSNDNGNDYDESDDNYRESERWSRALMHNVSFANHWSNRINYQEVSDLEFDDDFSRSGVINRTSYLKQNAELEFNDSKWKFLTRLEQYQTIDSSIANASKPYHRLPQVELRKLSTESPNEFSYDLMVQATRFTRNNDGLSGFNKIDGERLHTETNLGYPMQTTYGFLKPSLQLASTQYSFQNLDATDLANDYQDETSRNTFTAIIDAGLFFERSTSLFNQSFVQTLEPRIMLAYTPYEDQSDIPLFDTTETSFSYGSLFKANRFTGLDRIGDTQQVSLGLTSRFLNDNGTEVFRSSLGQIFYFDDRQVELAAGDTTLEATDQTSSSSLAGEVQWLFADDWRFKIDTQFDPHANSSEEPIEKASAQLNYQSQNHYLFDMNFSHVEATNQKQVGIALFAPINDRWAVYGQKKHDIYPYNDADLVELEEKNLLNIEGLLGIEYQNCCWRAQVTYEEHTQTDNTKDYQLMFQLHFKGLGNLGSNTDDILSERILGYEQRQIHDY